MRTNDVGCSGRPVEVTTGENIEKIHDMVTQDRRLKVSEIAKTTGISNERVHYILYKHLHTQKLPTRLVPCLLTIKKKHEQTFLSMVWSCFEDFDKSYYKDRIETLEHCWTNCSSLEGRLDWEIKQIFPKNCVFFILALTCKTLLVNWISGIWRHVVTCNTTKAAWEKDMHFLAYFFVFYVSVSRAIPSCLLYTSRCV